MFIFKGSHSREVTDTLIPKTSDKKLFRQKKCLKILASKIFCSPKILTPEIALNEKKKILFCNNYDKYSPMCGRTTRTSLVIVNKNNVFIFGVTILP